MAKKVTVLKIAEELSLAASTVHRALSGHPSVQEETRQKVLHAAWLKGYRLPKHVKNNIVVIVPSFIFKGYLSSILAPLANSFHRKGFRLQMIAQNDIALFDHFLCDGIVSLVWCKGLERLLPKKFSIPIITINAASNMLESVPVIMSDSHGIRLALDHLHDRGCRKIFFVSTETDNNPDAALRREEFRKFCTETGQDYESMYLEGWPKKIDENIPLILNSGLDACFCAREELAVKIGCHIKNAGFRIPEDISLMGLEDDYANASFTPPITAIRQNFEQIAAVTAEKMYQAIVNRIPPTCARIPFQLIERESVRNPEKG